MTSLAKVSAGSASEETQELIRQMRHYSAVGLRLFAQRQMIFAAAICLAAFYYQAWIAITTLVLIVLSEAYDYWIFRQIRRWRGQDNRTAKRFLYKIYFGTVLSASVISFFSLGIAIGQGHTTHFMPLFLLFAAALFAAMNNHHLVTVLVLRLVIYGLVFLFIPIRDIWMTSAPLHSELWTQFFTSIFVLYFIVDCSRIYLNFYRSNIKTLDALKVEHEKTKMAYRAKSEFLSTISHELRTPLASIKGSLDIANSGALGEIPDKVSRVLTIAQRNSVRLNLLIEEILDLQSIETGNMAFKFGPVNLAQILKNAVNVNTPFAQSCKASIELEPTPNDVFIRADQTRVEQVLANMLSNAAKFSHPEGKIIVRAKVETQMVRIEVVDEGIGLSEDDRDRVFDQFSQVDSSDNRHFGGTGLGMNISKRIMEAHDGLIGYTKNKGPGTTFFLEIARCEPANKTEDATTRVPKRGIVTLHDGVRDQNTVDAKTSEPFDQALSYRLMPSS